MKKSINVLLLSLLLIFIGWNAKPDIKPANVRIIDGKPYLVSTEIIRVTSAADLNGIPATTADVLCCVDVASTISSATLLFPTSPINGQTLSVTTRPAITTITNSAGGIPISGAVTTLAAGATVSYVYQQGANRWFRNP